MRILHIFDHSLPLHSGYAFRSAAILAQQRALGWQTLHLTGAKHGLATAAADGTPAFAPGVTPEIASDTAPDGGAMETCGGWQFHRTAPPRRWWARLPLLRQLAVVTTLAQRLLPLARAWRPDVLHAHSPVLNALAALYVGRRLGIPVLYEVRAFWEDAAADHGTAGHGSARYRLTRALESWALRRADAVTTICEGLRQELCARGLPAKHITVIPNAVEPALLTPPAGLARPVTDCSAAGPVIGFIGSFYAYEGLALLLQAMPRLLAERPALRLLLAGGGPQETALRTLVHQLGIAAAVTFAGRVPHAQVAQLYRQIDILVYPRLPMRLTELVTPLKPLEAMAQGRLVLASDVGGHRELIEHGQTGMLFRAGDATALCQALAALLDAPDSWPLLRARARAWVAQERTWPRSVARYAGVYGRLARQQCYAGTPPATQEQP